MTDDLGREIKGRTYNQQDMDRILVLNQRTRLVARRVMQFLKATEPFSNRSSDGAPVSTKRTTNGFSPSWILKKPPNSSVIRNLTANRWSYTNPAMTTTRSPLIHSREQARAVLDALLDKYADEGIRTLENAKVLKLKPFSDMGTPMEIINQVFGGKTNFENAIQELEQELFNMEQTA